jgi:polysaccharide deacetylase family protein (PEP-CTERM system associated)
MLTAPMPHCAAAPPAHIFSVDVEEYFQVRALEGVVARERWTHYPSRVEASIAAILELLERRRATGTFFTLGWIARHRPEVVRAIAAAGHEIASHGYGHRRVPEMTASEFREDVRSARAELEDLTGRPVLGYRAPNFSIVPGTEWALDILIEEGHRYDSSRFPVHRRGYGSPDTPRRPHMVRRAAGSILELPLATTTVLGIALPAAGGNYLRQLPYGLIRRAFREATEAGIPGMFYIHPWEVDPGQPTLPVGPLTRIRHYRGLGRTMAAMDRLLAEFPFTSVAAAYPWLSDGILTEGEA